MGQFDAGLGTGNSDLGGLTTAGVTNADKWWISLLVGLFAFIVFAAPTFSFTNSVFGMGKGYLSTWRDGTGASFFGMLLHAVALMLLTRLVLG